MRPLHTVIWGVTLFKLTWESELRSYVHSHAILFCIQLPL